MKTKTDNNSAESREEMKEESMESVSTVRSVGTAQSDSTKLSQLNGIKNFPYKKLRGKDLTEAQREQQIQMLGFATGTVSYFDREDVCSACGIVHSRPDLLDMYNSCRSCFSILREPSDLRKRFQGIKQEFPLDVLYATYGDPKDEDSCIIVTEECIERCRWLSPKMDRFAFRPTDKLNDVFRCEDPSPGSDKQLRMRYRIDGVHGTLVLNVNQENRLKMPFLLITPQLKDKYKYVRIFKAIYGYPKGLSSTGRMSYDVTEIVQSLVDQTGGSFLKLTSEQSLSNLFRDPCPKYPKDLRINYEVVGKGGTVVYSEIRNFLRKKVFIQSSPTVAPLIFVLSATYGITPTGRKDRLEFVNSKLRKIEALEHRRREGLTLTPDEQLFCKTKTRFKDEKHAFTTAPTCFIDISLRMQMIADKGGIVFCLDKDSFDPNKEFGNPSPGVPKLIECNLDCQGHDSERLAATDEMQDTGYARNYITTKHSRFVILVNDDDDGKGKMDETLLFQTDNAAPIIQITKAVYGELDFVHRCMDVTTEIQNKVVGRVLTVGTDVDLSVLFRRDPSPGKRKQLRISYITKGYIGNIRVREKRDFLIAGIMIGYPVVPPPDDDDFVIC